MPTYFIRKGGKIIGSVLGDDIEAGLYRRAYTGAEISIEEEVCESEFRYAIAAHMNQEASDIVIDMLNAFCRQDHRVFAVKYARKLTQWDLAKAKAFIDQNFAG